MKRTVLSLFAVLLCVLTVCAAVGSPEGELRRTETELYLADGTATGVLWTQMELSGTYGSKIVNVAQFDLSDPHLSVEVINSGETVVSSAVTAKACAAYNETHPGQTVLAAVNGDLFMNSVHSGSNVTKAVLKTTRGVLVIDGEVWASQQTDMENYGATNAEKNLPAGNMAAFGVTDENQPVVGSPDYRFTVTCGETKLRADGLNRLPAWDSLMLYNARLGENNYALNDSFEVELETDGAAEFAACGGTLTGTVRKIYPAGSTERPSLDRENVLVLTARGKRVSELENALRTGDRVTVSMTVSDRWGHTELWQNVREAIGGHIAVLLDGEPFTLNSDPSEYPLSLIGVRGDGSVMLCTVTSTKEKTYAGLRFSQAMQFCTELGYHSVFYLDGGGSTTFVTLEDGTYTVRNNCSDGAPRSVINSVGVVWNEEPVCEAQGDLDYIRSVKGSTGIVPTHLDGGQLYKAVNAPNRLVLRLDGDENALVLMTDSRTNDPYATLNFTGMQPVRAEKYPYLVFRLRHNSPETVNFKLYYAVGAVYAATESCTKTVTVPAGGEWQSVVADLSSASGWFGTIHNIRLDVFDGAYYDAGTSMSVAEIALCESREEAEETARLWMQPTVPAEPETEPEPVPEPEPEPVQPPAPEPRADLRNAMIGFGILLLSALISVMVFRKRKK